MALRITFSTARRSNSGVSFDSHGFALLVLELAPMGRSFNARFIHQLLHQLVEAHRIALCNGLGSPSARVTWNNSHQRIQPVRLLLNAIERGIVVVARARQLDGHAKPRQRRPQFVRNVPQQPSLGGQ